MGSTLYTGCWKMDQANEAPVVGEAVDEQDVLGGALLAAIAGAVALVGITGGALSLIRDRL